MNIYFSSKIRNLYFYEDTVIFPFNDNNMTVNKGVAYVVHSICKGKNDINEIAENMIADFNLSEDINDVRKMILESTLGDSKIKNAFTSERDNANFHPRIDGLYGKRYPQLLHIELTGACNFSCSHCYKRANHEGTYIDTDLLINKVCDSIKGIVPVLHLTGGEPTLHKDFAQIVNMLKGDFILQLSTNGSNIHRYPISLFKTFDAIDISLYGLSEREYQDNVGNGIAFTKVKQACQALAKENIKFRNTVVLNNNNWRDMEQYILFSIDNRADGIAFSHPFYSGKLIDDHVDKWNLNEKTKREIYVLYRQLFEKYGKIINIMPWTRTSYSSMAKYVPEDGSIRCRAGKNNWWMSEKLVFKPCSLLPDEYISMDYNSWYQCIDGESNIDWYRALKSLQVFASEHKMEVTEICSVFKNMPDLQKK